MIAKSSVMFACLLSAFAATFVSGSPVPQGYGGSSYGGSYGAGAGAGASYGAIGSYGGSGSYGGLSGSSSYGSIGAIGAISSYSGNEGSYSGNDGSYSGNDGSYSGNDGSYSGNDGSYSGNSDSYSHYPQAEEHYPDTPAHYQFKYEVTDFHTGDAKSHSETREGDTVRGAYSVADPDGHFRIVNYYADPHSGFQAHVSRIPIHGAGQTIAAAAPAPVAHAAPIASIGSHY